MTRPFLAMIAAVSAATSVVCSSAAGGTAVRVEFFREPGCAVCQRVSQEILDEATLVYADMVTVESLDIHDPASYLRLAYYQEHFGLDPHAPAILVVNGSAAFAGWPAIRDRFRPFLDEAVSIALADPDAAFAVGEKSAIQALTMEQLERRMLGFTLIGVMAAGLIDGINPCAISTLVFMVSVLSVLKIKGSRLLLVGGVFCLASFLTYLGIGLGLFRFLYALRHVQALQRGISVAMIAILLLFAVLSLRDAYCFRRSGRSGDVTLKLPPRIRDAIHRVIRARLGAAHLLAGAGAAGALVTVLESVCTGQVYLPTLVLVMRRGGSPMQAFLYILLYNIVFILPLVLALALAWQGTRMQVFMEWSRRNVVASKLFLAILFLIMAALFAIL